jgi:hypothetical protein
VFLIKPYTLKRTTVKGGKKPDPEAPPITASDAAALDAQEEAEAEDGMATAEKENPSAIEEKKRGQEEGSRSSNETRRAEFVDPKEKEDV